MTSKVQWSTVVGAGSVLALIAACSALWSRNRRRAGAPPPRPRLGPSRREMPVGLGRRSAEMTEAEMPKPRTAAVPMAFWDPGLDLEEEPTRSSAELSDLSDDWSGEEAGVRWLTRATETEPPGALQTDDMDELEDLAADSSSLVSEASLNAARLGPDERERLLDE